MLGIVELVGVRASSAPSTGFDHRPSTVIHIETDHRPSVQATVEWVLPHDQLLRYRLTRMIESAVTANRPTPICTHQPLGTCW